MEKESRKHRTITVSPNSQLKSVFSKKTAKSRVLTDNSGYAAAEFNFLFPSYSPALIVTEHEDDTSSWQ